MKRGINYISKKHFNYVFDKCYEFTKKKGMMHTFNTQLDILAACEDPWNIAVHKYHGEIWPLHQTGQMKLEEYLLGMNTERAKKSKGFTCLTKSFREEVNPIKDRHFSIFPLFEFEFPGDMEKLQGFEMEFLQYLGYRPGSFRTIDYNDACKFYETDEIKAEHENAMVEDFGPVIFLRNFPMRSSPFWNMKVSPGRYEPLAKKIDVILSGQEAIGSAERATDKVEMRKMFFEISDGDYAKTLFDKFGKDRVLKELDEYFNLNDEFVERSGGGIGMTRLIQSMEKEGLIPKSIDY